VKVWIDGALVDEADARVSPFDHGVLVGDGVFETMKVVDGMAFAMSRHLARLHRSCEPMRLEPPGDDALRDAVDQVIAANGPGVGRVRITVTGGAGPLGSGRGDGPCTTIVLAGDAPAWEPAAAVVVVPWPRNERSAVAGLKTTSYAENVVALAYAHERGASEALFANTTGYLCEGTGSNVFVAVGGRLLTPPLASGCLAGVTRELLLEVTDASEADIPIEALSEAEEMFLASSTRDVQPVTSIDGRPVAACPGALTEAARTAFAKLEAAGDLDP
jgi:branched-chain amino acid aminotransferase